MAKQRTKRKVTGTKAATKKPPSRRRRFSWTRLSDEDLLDLRFCDLGLKIEGTGFERHIEKLYSELRRRGLDFRPHFWLSTEWFTPDGVPGIAIPFYMAHPRLIRLEEKQMLEAEGATRKWCMQILRHETGHAIDNAYRLRRRRRWREMFGHSSIPYPDYYKPKPYSRRFVLHIDYWYAQSHPTEDFAETFAVWLTPNSRWRERYKGWPALKKLKYVDELMAELAETPQPVRTRRQLEPLSKLRTRLRDHYAERRTRYGAEFLESYDRDLRRLFSDSPRHRRRESAAAFIRRMRKELAALVASWTGDHAFVVNEVLDEMIERCRQLKLRVHRPDRQLRQELTVLLTVHTLNYLRSGIHRLMI